MAGDFHAAPALRDAGFGIDQERAALDPDVLAAVELLLLDHVERVAQRFVGIADQLEPEALLVAEVLVRARGVARDAEDVGAELAEFREQGGEVAPFGGAAGRVVLRIEVQHQPAACVVGQRGLARAVLARERERRIEDLRGSGLAVAIRTSSGP